MTTNNPSALPGAIWALPDFEDVRVLCVGDVLLDRFVAGSVERISPESPVPVLRLNDAVTIPGGAGNVARNIAAIGGTCTLVGVVGADAGGRELFDLLDGVPHISPLLVYDTSRPTTEKTRFVAQGQHLLRADQEETGPFAGSISDEIIARIAGEIDRHDVVILSDYAKGVLNDRVLAEAIHWPASAVCRSLSTPNRPISGVIAARQ